MIDGCIRLKPTGDKWYGVGFGKTRADLDAVGLVIEAPEFLGILLSAHGLPRAAMVAPGSTSGRVLLAVDESGGVLVVACPSPNSESELATVVGEVVAAGGRFWHQPYASLAGPFEEALGTPLADRVRAKASQDWSAEEFKTRVEASLAAGRFPIVVLASELSRPLQDAVSFLQSMNLDVTVLGYDYQQSEVVEFVRRKVLAGKAKPVERAAAAAREEPAPATTKPGVRPREKQPSDYPPFPSKEVHPKQEQILRSLMRIDDIGLVRKGFEYFVPGAELEVEAGGTVVVAVDTNRWPFPKRDEVLVVVNTDRRHLASFIDLPPEEIEEFLGSLPRVERKEHKGCVLLRAGTVQEAEQLVNELRTLVATATTRQPERSLELETPATLPSAAGLESIGVGHSPEQEPILAELDGLQKLGLVRRGLAYYRRGDELGLGAGATVEVFVDPKRWPFPKVGEVVVGVNTGQAHLGGHLKLSAEEIAEFLSALPKAEREDSRGRLLLRAASPEEAQRLVNELSALKQIAQTDY